MRGAGSTPEGMHLVGRDREGATLYTKVAAPPRAHLGPKNTSQPPRRAASKQPASGTISAPAQQDLKALDERFQAAITPDQLEALASQLGVTVSALQKVHCGWATQQDLRSLGASGAGWDTQYPDGAYSLPERHGTGRLVGFSFRSENGQKGATSSKYGCRRGLIVPAGLHHLGQPVLVVEGASDVAACQALGLAAVGRPSNSGGADELALLLDGRELLVVAENDSKDSGAWPGRDGAKAVAQRLASARDEPVAWALPPEEIKDMRDWLRIRVAAGLDLHNQEACRAAGQELLAALQAESREVRPPRTSAADRLVRLAHQHYQLGVSEDHEPFAVLVDGPNVALTISKNSELRSRLAADYQQQVGKAPSGAALGDALTVLEGQASNSQPEPVALRLAADANQLVLDLGTTDGAAVVIQPGAWELVERSPVIFRRTALTLALPRPERGGNLEDLRQLLNVSDETWLLVRGWLVAALLPEISHPVLMLGGQQGTGKSTAGRMLVELFDPSHAPLRSPPRDVETWATFAAASWGIVLDNISTIPPWLSDALCKAVTGDGSIRRLLYTNSGVSVLSFRRVIALTSIDPGALRGDLAERLLIVDLEPIHRTRRKSETAMLAQYQSIQPRLLGGLLDLTAKVLDELQRVQLPGLPRMADFARVLAAIDQVDGVVDPNGGSLAIYLGQSVRLAAEVIESDEVARAIEVLADSVGHWQGTTTELLDKITPGHSPRGWPRTARGLAGHLKRLQPALAQVGIEVVHERAKNRNRDRRICLTKVTPTPTRFIPSSATPDECDCEPTQVIAIKVNADGTDDADGTPQPIQPRHDPLDPTANSTGWDLDQWVS